jgi:class 3 adenylate cyclase
MYIVHTDVHGKIRLIENASIPIENASLPPAFEPRPELAEYQAFLGWVREHFRPPLDLDHPLPPSSILFLHHIALARFCQEFGIMLYVEHGAFKPSTDLIHHGVKLYFLDQAWTKSHFGEKPDEYSGLKGQVTKLVVPKQVLEDMNKELQYDDNPVRRISSVPISRTFAYFDISDFSKYKPGQEALIINALVGIVNEEQQWTGLAKPLFRCYEAMLCIGDGYIFVFKDPLNGVYFASYLAHLVEVLVANKLLPVDFHFRMGVHGGAVYSFWDPGRRDWNYIGDGINGGNRVLAAVGKEQDDTVFISGQVREAILASQRTRPEAARVLACLINRGRKADKHGNPWRVYELNHTALCGQEIPERFRNAERPNERPHRKEQSS